MLKHIFFVVGFLFATVQFGFASDLPKPIKACVAGFEKKACNVNKFTKAMDRQARRGFSGVPAHTTSPVFANISLNAVSDGHRFKNSCADIAALPSVWKKAKLKPGTSEVIKKRHATFGAVIESSTAYLLKREGCK